MKKAVLFDIDGTLLNSWDFIIEAVKYSLLKHNYPYPSEKVIEKALGKSLIEFYQIIAPAVDPLKLAFTHDKFQQTNHHLVKPYPKTKQVLKTLKNSGFLLAAVSNRSRDSLLTSLKVTEIHDYFDVIISPDDVKNPKPHKEHLLVALQELEVKPVNSLMVGDTEQDVMAGKNAKVRTVGVTYGLLGKRIAKLEPDFLIDDIGEILKILKCAKI